MPQEINGKLQSFDSLSFTIKGNFVFPTIMPRDTIFYFFDLFWCDSFALAASSAALS
jgi:hypothetical protein